MSDIFQKWSFQKNTGVFWRSSDSIKKVPQLGIERLLDEIHLEQAYYGSQRLKGALMNKGYTWPEEKFLTWCEYLAWQQFTPNQTHQNQTLRTRFTHTCYAIGQLMNQIRFVVLILPTFPWKRVLYICYPSWADIRTVYCLGTFLTLWMWLLCRGSGGAHKPLSLTWNIQFRSGFAIDIRELHGRT